MTTDELPHFTLGQDEKARAFLTDLIERIEEARAVARLLAFTLNGGTQHVADEQMLREIRTAAADASRSVVRQLDSVFDRIGQQI